MSLLRALLIEFGWWSCKSTVKQPFLWGERKKVSLQRTYIVFIAGLWTVTRDGSTFLPKGNPKILCATWSKCLLTPSKDLLWVLNPAYHLLSYCRGQVSMCSKKRALQDLTGFHMWGLKVWLFTPAKETGDMLNQDTWSKDLVRWELPLQSFSLKEIIISRRAVWKGLFLQH